MSVRYKYWEASEKVAGLQVQNQTAGNATSYVLWVTGETLHCRMFWMLEGPGSHWTNVTKEELSGTKKSKVLTADLATNGMKLDGYLVKCPYGLLGS